MAQLYSSGPAHLLIGAHLGNYDYNVTALGGPAQPSQNDLPVLQGALARYAEDPGNFGDEASFEDSITK